MQGQTDKNKAGENIRQLEADLVSQRKDLQNAYNQLGVVMDNMFSALLLEDPDRKIVYTNQQFCDLFLIPVKPDQLVGFDCVTAGEQAKQLFEDEENFLGRVRELITSGKRVMGDLLRMKNGTILERDFIPIYTDGKLVSILWQYRDMTEQRQTDFNLRQSETKYRTLVENLSMGLMEVDTNGIITKVYGSFCELTGYTEEELVGTMAINLLVDPADLERVKVEAEKRWGGESSIYELRVRKKDGEEMWVIISGTPLFDMNNRVVGSIGLHWDITSRKQKEDELREAIEIAERSSRVKKEFIAKMSHELRTPLNVIRGMAQLLQTSDLYDEYFEEVDAILKSTENLTGLVGDLLDISKIESGKMTLKSREFSLRDMILDLANHFYLVAADKRISFNLRLHPGVPEHMFSDELKLQQILNNLLGNAIKFTSKGYVNFDVSYAGETLIFTVTDTGIGIPADKQEHIFGLFAQAHENTDELYGGTGLGLTITRELISLFDGSISVVSGDQQGTCFKVMIPYVPVEEDDSDESHTTRISGSQDYQEELRNIRVLLVEDNPMNQVLVGKIFQSWEVEFDLACNGKEALHKLEEFDYDLVLMDVFMPVMDGVQATREIRRHQNFEIRNKPVIGLSAFGTTEEIQQVLHAGMNDFVMKPFDLNTLRDVMLRWKNVQMRPYRYLDLTYFSENGLTDKTAITHLTEIYVNTSQIRMNRINDAFNTGDISAVKIDIHSLKSDARLFGLKALVEPLVRLERNPEMDAEELNELKSEIQFVYQHSLEEIKQFLRSL